MNARSLVVTIAALGFSSLSLAQEPNFGDLGVTETSTYHRASTVRPSEIDTKAFDATCGEARELLDGAFAHFRAIYLGSERIVHEAEGNYALGHWNKDRFEANKAEAAALRSKVARLSGMMTRLENFFSTLSLEDRKNYDMLLERHADVVTLLTEYNTLVEWAAAFNLDYDTMVPFDELDFTVLERNEYAPIPFPILPLLQISETVNRSNREEVEGRDGTPLIHEEQTLASTRTVLRRAVDPARVGRLFTAAVALADQAEESRSRIVVLAADASSRTLLYRGTLEEFEGKVKPAAVDYGVTMLRFKAARNSLFALLEGSDLYEGDANLRARWEELDTRFADLASWGDAHSLEFDRIHKTERNFRFFFTANFQNSNLFGGQALTGMGKASGGTVVGTIVPLTDPISATDAIRLVKSVSGASRRRDLALKVIPRVQGMSAEDLSNISSWIDNSSYRETVVSFGLQYLNR